MLACAEAKSPVTVRAWTRSAQHARFCTNTGCDVSCDNTSPLPQAHAGIVAALLHAGADASSRDDSGATPLTYAIDASRRNEVAVAVLLEHETRPGRAMMSHELRRMLKRACYDGELEECMGDCLGASSCGAWHKSGQVHA